MIQACGFDFAFAAFDRGTFTEFDRRTFTEFDCGFILLPCLRSVKMVTQEIFEVVKEFFVVYLPVVSISSVVEPTVGGLFHSPDEVDEGHSEIPVVLVYELLQDQVLAFIHEPGKFWRGRHKAAVKKAACGVVMNEHAFLLIDRDLGPQDAMGFHS